MTETTQAAGRGELGQTALFYPFAHRFAPKAKHGCGIPCHEGQYELDAVTSTLLACAFWSVQDDGLIRIERYEQSRKGIRKGRAALRAILIRDEPRVGVEAGVLQAISKHAKPDDSVADVVAKSKSKDKPPLHPPAGVSRELLIERGFGERIGRTFITRKLVWNCERIATLEPEFERAWARWERFGEHEPQLRADLIAECRGGMVMRGGVDAPTFTGT